MIALLSNTIRNKDMIWTRPQDFIAIGALRVTTTYSFVLCYCGIFNDICMALPRPNLWSREYIIN